MSELTRVGRAITAVGCMSLSITAPFAQDNQRVEVTGSLIRRVSAQTATQIVTLSADELQKQGVTNAEQAVKFITQQQGGTVTSASVSTTNGAAAYANLRSLGAGRTLVLLNGNRVAPNPFDVVGTDLNTLPLSAVSRIEALADGASSIYGTDAVAGVINFITWRDYRGASVGAGAQVTQHGGGDVKTASLLAGLGDADADHQGWNVYAALSLRRQDSMRGDQRDFSRTAYQPELGLNATSPTTSPANYNQTGMVPNANVASPACDPPGSISVPEANGSRIRCFADTQTYTNTVPSQEQNALLLKGSLAFGMGHAASLEYFRSRNTVATRIAPAPEGGLTMPQTSPYYPGNGIYAADPALDTSRPITLAWRTVPLGAREFEQKNITQRLVASIEGAAAGWDYQAHASTSSAKVRNVFLNGYPASLALRAAIAGCASGFAAATGACATPLLDASGNPIFLNPFGAQSAAGQTYLESIEINGQVQDGKSSTRSVAATVSRALTKLAGGDAVLAANVEARKENMVYNTDIAKVSQAASSGLAGAGALREGDRDIEAVALEFVVPVLKGLEIGLSVRYDRYSDFGATTNPKAALRWQPNDLVLLRASANTGFAAPSLYQLVLPNQRTFTANRYNDPVLCPGGVPDTAAGAVPARDCGLQFQQIQGGNRQLKAEKSKAWSVGFVVAPTNSFGFGFDYWDYEIRDSISTIGEQSIFADPTKYAGLFQRCSEVDAAQRAAIGACQNPGTADPLAYILNTFQNLGDVRTKGIDGQADFTLGSTPLGRWRASYRGTYVTKYDFQIEHGGRYFNPVGNYLAQFAGPVIRYQHVITLGLQGPSWSTLLSNRHVGGYRDQNSQGAPFNVVPFNTNTVGKYSVFDVAASWTGVAGLTLQGGVLNLFDTNPPFTNQVGRFQARGYDDRFHNPLGRTFQVSLRYDY